MKTRILLIVGAQMLSTPLVAQGASGDPDAGASQFDRQCTACHVVADDAGEVLAGRNARTGPNLFGVVGAPPGSRHDFPYSDALVAYGETGATWTEETLPSFVLDPTGHLREALDDPRARSKMAFKLRDAGQARDVYAFLAGFSDGAAAGDATDEAAADGAAADTAAGDASAGAGNAETGSAAGAAETGSAAGAAATDAAPGAAATDAAPGEALGGTAAGAVVADIAAGETIYKTTCRNCHGPKAQGMASFPKLADKDAAHLVTRLEQYRAGETVGPNSALMIPVAMKLSDEDIANVTAYITTAFD